MRFSLRAASLVLAACGLITGCATRGPLLDPAVPAAELAATPFFPQRVHQCGPAALATVLGASGVNVTPDELTPLVYLPGRRGSLQVDMQATPRRYGRLAYRVDPELKAIAAEVDAGRPVLVLHNYGLPVWPRWHYAVVIGHDAARQRVLLRSGTTFRQQLSAAHFMRAWDNGDRWALVLLRPGELPAAVDRQRYLEAATAFERSAAPEAARLAWDAAIRTWPDDAVGYLGRGTARYRAGALREAAADYAAALSRDSALHAARNNLAMTLLELGCPAAAAREMDRLDASVLPESLRAAVEDTRAQISARKDRQEASGCSAPP